MLLTLLLLPKANIYHDTESSWYQTPKHISKINILSIWTRTPCLCLQSKGSLKSYWLLFHALQMMGYKGSHGVTKSSEPTVASKESDIFHRTFTKATTSSRLVVVLIRSSGESRIFKALVCLRSFNGMPNYMKKNMNDENTFWWLFFTVSKTPVTTISKTRSRCPTIPNCFQGIWGT